MSDNQTVRVPGMGDVSAAAIEFLLRRLQPVDVDAWGETFSYPESVERAHQNQRWLEQEREVMAVLRSDGTEAERREAGDRLTVILGAILVNARSLAEVVRKRHSLRSPA